VNKVFQSVVQDVGDSEDAPYHVIEHLYAGIERQLEGGVSAGRSHLPRRPAQLGKFADVQWRDAS